MILIFIFHSATKLGDITTKHRSKSIKQHSPLFLLASHSARHKTIDDKKKEHRREMITEKLPPIIHFSNSFGDKTWETRRDERLWKFTQTRAIEREKTVRIRPFISLKFCVSVRHLPRLKKESFKKGHYCIFLLRLSLSLSLSRH